MNEIGTGLPPPRQQEPEQEPRRLKGRDGKKKAPISAMILSTIFHVLLIVGAGYLTVLVINRNPPPMFEAKKPPSIPPKKLEHSIRVKQMKKQTRKPQILERLVSKTPSSVALPELPKMEMPDMKNLRDTPLLNAAAGANVGAVGGKGGGAGRGLTGGAGYSDTKFFGQNVRTKAVTICMDISPSMVAKGVVEEVRREAKEMLNRLTLKTKFNIIVFVDGATAFSQQMVFATKENKEKADQWLSQEFDARKMGQLRGFSGSTPFEAIKLAVEVGSDTVFVLGDDLPYLSKGTFDSNVEIPEHVDDILDFVRGIEANYGRKVRINNIAYRPNPGDRGNLGIDYMKKVSRITGGRFKKVTKLKFEDPYVQE